MSADVSLLVTVHSESVVCGPTMRSAELAVQDALDRGIGVETILVLDRPNSLTRTYFDQAAFDSWTRLELDLGDVGLARNESAKASTGRYLAFLDADDLISQNWLAAACLASRQAEEEGVRAIIHPELNVFFDGMRTVRVNVDQRSPLFTPLGLCLRNYYDTMCMAPREAHLELPYGQRDLAHGISREDFQFAIESLAAGWEHRTVPDTIIFKRRRDASLATESNARRTIVRALPAMAIDRVRQLGSGVVDSRI